MKLDYESSLLTTMNTPIGRYRWLKLPFGIKSAPEMYQRTMNEMLEGIDHAYAIVDDILITGRNVAHHDLVLEAVLQRAKSYNLRLNFDNVKYASPKSNMWATLSQKKDSNLTQKK